MARQRNVGGRRRRAWRLKKKYKKRFHHVLQTLMKDTLNDLPKKFFENMWYGQDYEACRIYK